jgi:carbon monoxide dehydrogenase subunit G
MHVHGTHRFEAPREAVFAAIRDPRTLIAVIPGCEDVQLIADDRYQGRIMLRLPGATGRYTTDVQLVDLREPEHAGLRGTVEGTMGSIKGDAQFDLATAGEGTVLKYDGTAVIQGPLARLDSRFAEKLAESLISQGLKALDARLVAEVVA